ncbi:hypothetical protein FRB90_007738, partial [Tulasnella sp. 427]
TAIFNHCHSYSPSSSASSPPTSSTAGRRRAAAPSYYTPPDDNGSAAYSTGGVYMSYPQQQQEQQARHHQPYPSPPPTMQAFQHSLLPQHQQQLPPLSSIVPSSSPFASQQRPLQRIRTKSSGAAIARQHLPAVQPMQHDRTTHTSAAFAYQPSYGQPGPTTQANALAKTASTASTIPQPPPKATAEQQQQPRMVQGRQQQHVVPTNHPPEATRTSRIANFVAHNTCAMICYIWFGDSKPANENAPSSSEAEAASSSNPYSPSFPTPQSNTANAKLQFCPSKQFVEFMHTLLTTTQVSQGVIVLSLCYIYRLKRQHPEIEPQAGSELRLALVGLMLANKFLDDNTYTNGTWSQIAKIPLEDINSMEREFLLGLGHQLFIDQKAYEGWLLMLNGLMWAKEREYDGWRRMVYGSATNLAQATDSRRIPQETLDHQRPHVHALPRARSTSPIPSTAPASAFPFTFTLPPLQQPSSNPFSAATTPTKPHPQQQQFVQPAPRPQLQNAAPPPIPLATRPTTTGSKRTLGDASFSPDLKPPPAKRPLSGSFAGNANGDYGMSVPQPQARPTLPQPHSYSAYQVPHHAQPMNAALLPPPLPQAAAVKAGAYRIPSASEMLGIESRSTASSDDSRTSSGMGGGGYADGSGELRAALGRMSLEPSARGEVVMVKQEEEEEDEDEDEDVKEEEYDEEMLPSHVRAESVVEHLVAPYQADERMVLKGLPQYLTFNTLVASPSGAQPPAAQSQSMVIPPPASTQERHYAYGARDRGKSITRVQVNQYPSYAPVPSAANALPAFSIGPPAGRNPTLGTRSARTSPTGLGFGFARGFPASGMDVDSASSFGARHVSQPQPAQQRQYALQRVQQQQALYSNVQQVVSPAHPRLPPLQTQQQVIPPPATAAPTNVAAVPSSSNYHHSSAATPSHYATSPYNYNPPTTSTAYVTHQPQGSFANAGPPGYQWPTDGTGFGGAPSGSGQYQGYSYNGHSTAAAVATPVHPVASHHQPQHYAQHHPSYAQQVSSPYARLQQQDARWGHAS